MCVYVSYWDWCLSPHIVLHNVTDKLTTDRQQVEIILHVKHKSPMYVSVVAHQ